MRAVKSILLLAMIAFFAVFIYSVIAINGPRDNWFNLRYRLQVARYPLLRKIYSLHDYGDARADYLGSRYQRIYIQVNVLAGVGADNELLQRFAGKVAAVTGKEVEVGMVLLPFSYPELDPASMAAVIADSPLSPPAKNQAGLLLLLADERANEPKLLGSTIGENGIVLYQGALDRFTETTFRTYQKYAFSTLLHEFGHQPGLEHNDSPGCIMNVKAETDDQPKADPAEVTVEYCSSERQQIESQKIQNP